MAPLRRPLTIASLVPAMVGLALSAYLSYAHYNLDALACGTGSCELVQTSEYSEMYGVPIALFGVTMFVVVIAGIILRERRSETADLVSTAILAILLTAILYWIYLTYLEINVIHAVCQWCVASSLVTLTLLIVEAIRWYRNYTSLGEE